MKDKNGTEIKVGDKVVDVYGRYGEVVEVNNAKAIRFNTKGGVKYTFAHKLNPQEIMIVE